jgi:hypothetical protein
MLSDLFPLWMGSSATKIGQQRNERASAHVSISELGSPPLLIQQSASLETEHGGGETMAGGPVEREDQDAGTRPLLVTVTVKGASGEESAASSSIAVVVASTAVAVAGSFEFGISVGTCPDRPPLNRDTERLSVSLMPLQILAILYFRMQNG